MINCIAKIESIFCANENSLSIFDKLSYTIKKKIVRRVVITIRANHGFNLLNLL